DTKRYIVSKHDDRNTLALTDRYDFDKWFKSQANSPLIEHITDEVVGIVIDDGHYKVYCKKNVISGVDFVIAADGANSKFGEAAHGKFKNYETIAACESIIDNKTKTSFAHVIQNPTKDPLNGGYSWIFAKKNTANVGTGVVRNYDRYYTIYKNSLINYADKIYNIKIERFDRNWIIPLFNVGRNMYIDNTYKSIVIGDALGVADVFFAEGWYGSFVNAYETVEYLKTHNNFEGFKEHWYSLPYAKDMSALGFLQTQANGDSVRAFNLLCQKGVFEGFLDFISGEIKPSYFVRWVNRHYPIRSLSLYVRSKMREGKESNGKLYYKASST
ncbi:MAG: hypothetical protein OWS74_05340, partial [Firmicutes bacterium]|nr:hypothetical protein [Bacillota bacterium]